MNAPQTQADVLVVGAGPVGLSVAMDLSARGAKVIIAETRAYKQPPEVKCNHVAARTMERFRKLGVAQKLRNAGLPEDFPNDVAFRTTATGTELARIRIPGRRDRYISRDGPDTGWPTPEPAHRINQTFLEPILVEHTAALPGVTLLNRTQVTGFTQDAHGVEATLRDLETNEERNIRARFLIGCDGGSSMVRKAIGAKFEGTPVIQQVQSTFIRAPKLLAMLPRPLYWCMYAVNPRRCGSMFAIDGKETWLIHNHLNPGEKDFDAIDRDWAIRTILGVGDDFEYEVISKEDWVGRRLVANRFRDRNVFIAGDAAHLWVPYAGYGMNAGIADGLNLSWLLGAVLQGWGDAKILDAYEAERQPITQQVSNFAMEHAAKMIRARSAVPVNIEADDEAGQRERERMGKEAYELNVQQFAAGGLNFGYYYDASPIIAYDGEPPPAYSMGGFTASTVPGCRAPHFWLADGRSIYDAFGPGYTLLRLDRAIDIEPLVRAARGRRMPLEVLDVQGVVVPPAYRHKLLVVREDQHVAWRGDVLPQDACALVEALRGKRD
ncbi:MAG TPA: FAD-dependent oxidoreductase [Ramlibacter sp.]|nr:FAD-dependent oxidoreductase [Ramlibacter sp.]